MNITVILFSILISVICMLLALVQYYYLNFKKATSVRLYEPLFHDLIVTDFKPHYAIDYDKSEDGQNKYNNRNHRHTTSDTEVDHCLKAALAYKLSGKSGKALKLFEHAAAIAPDNPDVLNRYGEYLEQMHKDVVSADELYFKALTYSPEHMGALINRKRTAHLVDQMDLMMFNVIDEKLEILKQRIKSEFDFEVKKKVYYLHIYHTVGIEGNTMTLSQLQYLLETGRAVGGKSIVEHNEILGLEIALRYVKFLTTTNTLGISEILEIHRRVMGHVEPLQAGVFRNQQVFVGSHVPPAPEDLPSLMESYVEWLNSEEAQSMHPVRYAALAHYKLVDIHPFTDGNGRTSRLIMNLILLRSDYPPIIINKEDRQKYYEYLNIANKGDIRPFVRFIAYSTDETINTYLGRNKLLNDHSSSTPIIEFMKVNENTSTGCYFYFGKRKLYPSGMYSFYIHRIL